MRIGPGLGVEDKVVFRFFTSMEPPMVKVILIETCPDMGCQPAWGDVEIKVGTIKRFLNGFRFDLAYLLSAPENEGRDAAPLRYRPHELVEYYPAMRGDQTTIGFEVISRTPFGGRWPWQPIKGEIINVLMTSSLELPFLVVPSVSVLERDCVKPTLYSSLEHRYVIARSTSAECQRAVQEVSRCIEPFHGLGVVELV